MEVTRTSAFIACSRPLFRRSKVGERRTSPNQERDSRTYRGNAVDVFWRKRAAVVGLVARPSPSVASHRETEGEQMSGGHLLTSAFYSQTKAQSGVQSAKEKKKKKSTKESVTEKCRNLHITGVADGSESRRNCQDSEV
jgi:hypothetical protein